MILSALLGCLGGVLLALRFKVFVLVPVLLAAIALTAIAIVAGSLPPGQAVLMLLCFAVSLQAGYGIMTAVGAATRKPSPARPLTT